MCGHFICAFHRNVEDIQARDTKSLADHTFAAPLARALGGGVHIADLWLVQELAALTTNSSSKLHILRHHGDAFAVDSTKVAIVKEMNQISL